MFITVALTTTYEADIYGFECGMGVHLLFNIETEEDFGLLQDEAHTSSWH